MTINDLMQSASSEKFGERLSMCWDRFRYRVKPVEKDPVAVFIAQRLLASYKPRRTSQTQLKCAIDELKRIQTDVKSVIAALAESLRGLP